MTAAPHLRPVRPDDRAALAQIAYHTGFFGASAAVYFPDAALFGALWMEPYLGGAGVEGAGAAGFVADLDGVVLGYIVGAPDHGAYQRALTAVVARFLTTHRPTPDTLRSLRYLVRAARYSSPHADWMAYPAHLHLNLLPAARGLGVGRRLLDAHLSALGGLGVPGVQLSTTTENGAAITLYGRAGFGVLASRDSPLWMPWLGRATTHVVMGRRCPGWDPDRACPD
ncbi:GNAT family N-acetyltransferase [Deinococcus sp. KSM4-11]|uniref:GNAT family N-acetyltransferase n=1 Tax=Deinococcus sp. KSM4-11 TaxID=2568654 RepID=UPI0010A4D04D|nr:GNAT family N-acetyltransferase [Deinococcus sp. KSM4-11]THF85107.1 GNAT family N-acetyltransferase [Deinococcus sp. KSM4-11]